MIFRKSDLSHLKWPLLTCAAILCANSIAIMFSIEFSKRAQEERLSAQRQLNAEHLALASAREDHNNMQVYRLEYGELLERGIIGEERRLDWIEDMEALRRHRHMPDFSYNISPQHPYTPQPGTNNGYLEAAVSDMELQLDLLHEKQLLDLLDQMHSGPHGRFILNGCSMERIAEPATAPGLKATCSGGWLTLAYRKP